jgi:hypothetical protein
VGRFDTHAPQQTFENDFQEIKRLLKDQAQQIAKTDQMIRASMQL